MSHLRRETVRNCRASAVLASVVALAYLVGCGKRSSGAAPSLDQGAASAPSAVDAGSPAIPSASVEAYNNPGKLPEYTGPMGSVEGAVFVKGPEAPDLPGIDFQQCPAALDTYGKLFRAGPARADGLRPLADAVVVITGYGGFVLSEKAASARVVVGAQCAYPTRTIAITFGQTLLIANDSTLPFGPVLSNQYQPAIMIAPPMQQGEPVKLVPPRPGHYMISDQLQPYVRETLLVLRQPLHAVTDLAGHFRIDGVPVGKRNVGTQLDALGVASQPIDIEVRPNVVESVELALTYTPAPTPTGPAPRVIP